MNHNGRPYNHCYTMPYNTGHFHQGVWIPDCKMCGLCCRYLWIRRNTDNPNYETFELMHEGVSVNGDVVWVYCPCKNLVKHEDTSEDGDIIRVFWLCRFHDTERPECCKDFGYGDYYHPKECVFDERETVPEV